MMRRILSGVGANMIDKLVIAAMQVAIVPVLVGRWGVHVYGLWVLIATIPAFLAFSDFGFATAAGTTMTMQIARGERTEAARTFATARVAIFASAALIIIAGAATIILLPLRFFASAPGFPAAEMKLTIAILLAWGVVCLQNTTSMAGYRATGRYHLGVLSHSAIYFSENVMLIVVVALGGRPAAAAAALLVARVIGVTLQRICLLRMVPWLGSARLRTSWPEVKALIRPARAVMAIPAANAALLQGSALALGAAAGAAAVPIFTTARTLARIGLQVTAMVSTALIPEFSSAGARGDRTAQAHIVALALLGGLGVAIPFALLLGVFGPDIVRLWTHGALAPPSALLWALAASTLLGGFWNPVSNLLLALNLQGRFAFIFLGLSLLSIPIAMLLSSLWGATGTGLSLLFVDAGMALLILVQLRHLKLSPEDVRRSFGHWRRWSTDHFARALAGFRNGAR